MTFDILDFTILAIVLYFAYSVIRSILESLAKDHCSRRTRRLGILAMGYTALAVIVVVASLLVTDFSVMVFQ